MEDESIDVVENADVNEDGITSADSKIGDTIVVTSSEFTVDVDVFAVKIDGRMIVSEIA